MCSSVTSSHLRPLGRKIGHMTQFSRNTKSDLLPMDNPGAHRHGGAHSAPGMPGVDQQPRRNVMLALWTRRWIVVATMAAALIVAGVHLYRAPRIYQASARVTVERAGPHMVNNDPS